MNQLRVVNRLVSQRGIFMSACQFSSELGSGAGKGGGGGGTIREAGGSFGKREAAVEEQYFRKLVNISNAYQAEQLHNLKDHMSDEVSFHEEQIKRHQEALDKAKQKLAELGNEKN